MTERPVAATPKMLAAVAVALLACAGCAGSPTRSGSDQLAAGRYQPGRWLQSAAPTPYPSESAAFAATPVTPPR